jgi:hypothetical protein
MVANSYAYMQGRKQYSRPQAMLFANNPGTIVEEPGNAANKFYIPLGQEINSSGYSTGADEFLILSDDNRQPIDMKQQRIEKRERTVNGRMRSYHVADKLTISTSWQTFPSRAFDANPTFNSSGVAIAGSVSHTSDGGAGGVELLDWYENYTGSFWVYLAYDKYDNFGKTTADYGNLLKYNEVVEVFFSDFSYTIEKRGATNFDFWNVSLSLEEV